MYYRFEKLEIWQEARQFVNTIYQTTKDFPSSERFGLTDQIRRAALSILLNITEGSDKKSDLEFRRFLRVSIGSLEEVVAALYIALDQHYIDQEDFDSLYHNSHLLVARINSLVKILSNFLLWQTAYSELYFTQRLWPDFSPEELKKAIKWYQSQKRNFGK